jgi:hypothetical protein
MVIKINNQLQKYASVDPTKESKPVSLGNLCQMIEEGKMTLPIFQTYIRWRIEKCVDLLNFQLSGKAAVSPISVNIIENKNLAVPQVTFIERKLISSSDDIVGKQSVNDGQQRLSCNFKAYIDHDDFKCIVLDISRGKFILNMEALKKSQIPVGKLYNKDRNVFKEYLSQHKALQEFEVQNLLTAIRNKFLGYYYTVNYARDLTEFEQQQWFRVLNLAGSTVSKVEVELTNMLIKGVDYYKEYANGFREILRQASLEGLFVFKDTEISIPLAALNPAYEVYTESPHKINFSPIPSDTKANLISELEAEQIRKIFSMTLKALQQTLDFIDDNKLEEPKRIDYITYIIGVFVYINGKQINDKQKDLLIDWYNTVEFSKKDNGERRKIFEELLSNLNLII